MADFVPGSIANDKGDLFGTTPLRVIPFGRVVVDAPRAPQAVACGWRVQPKIGECDQDFVWLERTKAERDVFAALDGLGLEIKSSRVIPCR